MPFVAPANACLMDSELVLVLVKSDVQCKHTKVLYD